MTRLLRQLAQRDVLPRSQLAPALTLARKMRVPQPQAAAVAVTLAVGWAEATGRGCNVANVAAVVAAEVPGAVVTVADVREQLAKLSGRWGVSGGRGRGREAGRESCSCV